MEFQPATTVVRGAGETHVQPRLQEGAQIEVGSEVTVWSGIGVFSGTVWSVRTMKRGVAAAIRNFDGDPRAPQYIRLNMVVDEDGDDDTTLRVNDETAAVFKYRIDGIEVSLM